MYPTTPNPSHVCPSYQWVDPTTILIFAIPEGAVPPKRSVVPAGPNVQDSTQGSKVQLKTFQNLLKVGCLGLCFVLRFDLSWIAPRWGLVMCVVGDIAVSMMQVVC